MLDNSPEIVFKELFEDLHLSGLWEDGKFISDAVPKRSAEEILSDYHKDKTNADFNLKTFFERNFDGQGISDSNFISDTNLDIKEHIEKLWTVLSRNSLKPVKGSSELELPFAYIVPGGRFNEIYYWDSYFTMLGLKESGKIEMIQNMIDNFAFMIDRFGFIPNGSRSYFLTRSQPPFFALMVELLAGIKGDHIYKNYHSALITEYNFWMKGHKDLDKSGSSKYRVVSQGRTILNRYFDSSIKPRTEMYGADVELFKSSGREAESLYQNLRAACESGWDFSSRWLNFNLDLATIHSTHILPVDLNCLIYKMECIIARSYHIQGDLEHSNIYKLKSENRAEKIRKLFWSGDSNFFMDYHFKDKHLCYVESLAGLFPLFFKIASKKQADKVAVVVENEFLKDGGLITTTNNSGQQWDAPNGWAPLQYISIVGLRNYGFHELAEKIKSRWIDLNIRVYKDTGKLLEKYNVVDIDLVSGGGEYPVQDGFGWTNGVLLKLLNESSID